MKPGRKLMPLNELAGIRGIKAVRAIRLAAAYELCQGVGSFFYVDTLGDRQCPWTEHCSKYRLRRRKSAGGALNPLVVSGRPSSDYDDQHGPQSNRTVTFLVRLAAQLAAIIRVWSQ
jgi:hypothetical protein